MIQRNRLWYIIIFYNDNNKRRLFLNEEEIEDFLKNHIYKDCNCTNENLNLIGDFIYTTTTNPKMQVGFVDWSVPENELIWALKHVSLKDDERELLLRRWGLTQNSRKITNEDLIEIIGLDEFRRLVYIAKLKNL